MNKKKQFIYYKINAFDIYSQFSINGIIYYNRHILASYSFDMPVYNRICIYSFTI